MGELLLFQNGFNGSSESFGSGIPLISVMDVLDDKFITHETVRGKARLNCEEASRYCVEYGDVLFQRSSENQEDAGTSNVYLDQHVSSAFGGFVIRGKKVGEYNPIFIKYLLGSPFIREQITHRAQGAQHINVSQDTLADVVLLMPSMREQEAVGLVFLHLDNLITLHQRECGKPPFNQSPAWEQRKFSDLVLIERGGSPRPIDAYITEDPAGLNWVKIGDAPSMGRYITTTSEKIKPEGLSKTRQVYPGDLVLSNSMSFGRPYIMAVEGCIHDGWLLIRDTQNQFDPVFLCHMLGTPQMLDQYRMFASGSTVNNLNKELVGNAMVPLPDRDEQVKIGNYLDELDGLITLHQRMCPIFSFCAHGSRTNFAQTLQGWLQILRYPRPIPKMLVSPSAPASGVFGTAKGAFICASSSAGASTSSPSARKNFITSSTLCCRESLSSP